MSKTYQCSYTWSCNTFEIIEHIWMTYQIRFNISGPNKWLHHHGFSDKKPKGVPHKFDPDKQATFIEEYKVLKAQPEITRNEKSGLKTFQ